MMFVSTLTPMVTVPRRLGQKISTGRARHGERAGQMLCILLVIRNDFGTEIVVSRHGRITPNFSAGDESCYENVTHPLKFSFEI
jgi:hypothetical protein